MKRKKFDVLAGHLQMEVSLLLVTLMEISCYGIFLLVLLVNTSMKASTLLQVKLFPNYSCLPAKEESL